MSHRKGWEDSLKTRKINYQSPSANLAEVLRNISTAYDLGIVIDREVDVKTPVDFHKTPLLEGLEALCKINGFEFYREGGHFRVSRADLVPVNELSINDSLIDVNVRNLDVQEFVDELAQATKQKFIKGNELTGKVNGVLRNVGVIDGLQVLLETNGFHMRRSGEKWIIEGSRVSPAPLVTRPLHDSVDVHFQNGRITARLTKTSLAKVVKAVAKEAHLTFIYFGELNEGVNATLVNVSLEDFFAVLMKGSHFTYSLVNGFLTIGPVGSLSALALNAILPVQNLKSETALLQIPKIFLTQGMEIKNDKEQNAILVRGSSEQIENLRQALDLIDVPTSQVYLECLVVEVSHGSDYARGIKSGSNLQTNSQPALQGQVGASFGSLVKRTQWPQGAVTVGMLDELTTLDLTMSDSHSSAKILSKTGVSTVNGNKANIVISNTSYSKVVSFNADGSQVTDFRPFDDGLSLEVTPSISQNSEISLEVQPRIKSAQGASCTDCPPDVISREMHTQVLLHQGQSLRLGGLVRTVSTQTRSYVPFLGSIPGLDRIFSFTEDTKTDVELIIYITPKAIADPLDSLPVLR